MKKIYCFALVFSLLMFCATPARASSVAALGALNSQITSMAKKINLSSTKMMQFADMLICNSLHGKASYIHIEKIGVHIHAVDIFILISGGILYVLGFLIMLMSSFFLFDVAFNISITIAILPLGFALWPFGWTRDKLKPMIGSIVYYTGVFIFLPMGINLAVTIVNGVADGILGGDFIKAFDEDKSDVIQDNLSLISLGFWKMVLSYLVAIKIIPLMAIEFCSHFFGEALVGNPMNERITQAIDKTKQAVMGKVGGYAKDVATHHTGKAISKMGNKDGNFLSRAVHRYGENLADNTPRE